MKRIEIIFSQAIEEDILAALAPIPEARFFTLIPGVKGRGYSTPKMGDPVWPEENELMIIYCADEKAAADIESTIIKLQQRFTTEGLAFFVMNGRE
jgi:hypothetical protein